MPVPLAGLGGSTDLYHVEGYSIDRAQVNGLDSIRLRINTKHSKSYKIVSSKLHYYQFANCQTPVFIFHSFFACWIDLIGSLSIASTGISADGYEHPAIREI